MTDKGKAGRSRNDLSRQVFGRLRVLRPAENYVQPRTGKAYTKWLCRCECGKKIVVRTTSLLSGNTVSCGCARKKISDDLRNHPSSRSLLRLHWAKSSPYEDLANAIIAVAADDYRAALDDDDQKQIASIEGFFYSEWFGVLSKVNPYQLINALQRESRGELGCVYIEGSEI